MSEENNLSADKLLQAVARYAEIDAVIKTAELEMKENTAALRKRREGLKSVIEATVKHPFKMRPASEMEGVGTVSTTRRDTFKIVDRDKFEDWLYSDEAYDMEVGFRCFSASLSKEMMEDIAEKLGKLPPGIEFSRYDHITHRKS